MLHGVLGPQKGYVSGLTYASYRKDNDVYNGWQEHVDGLNPPQYAERRHEICQWAHTEEQAGIDRDRFVEMKEHEINDAPMDYTWTSWVLGGEQGAEGEWWAFCVAYKKTHSDFDIYTEVFAISRLAMKYECASCGENSYVENFDMFLEATGNLLIRSWREHTDNMPANNRGRGCFFSRSRTAALKAQEVELEYRSGEHTAHLPRAHSWQPPSEFLASSVATYGMDATPVADKADAATQAQATKELVDSAVSGNLAICGTPLGKART